MTEFLFNVLTPLGYSVHSTVDYWIIISTIKHPVLDGCESEIILTLRDPDEIRVSKSDPAVHLFHRQIAAKKYLCAVAKIEGSDGFLITAYPTDSIKEGTVLWKK